MDITKDRCPFGNGFGIALFIEGGQHHRFPAQMAHDYVADPDIFHHSAASAGGFNPDSPLRAVKDAIGNSDIPDTAGHLAADDHAAMTIGHGAVRYGNILGWSSDTPAIGVAARFDGDTVVPHADIAVG